MRKLVEEKILELWNGGQKEIGLSYLMFARAQEGRLPLSGVIGGFRDFPFPKDRLIEPILAQLTDRELLTVLDAQLCEKYR